MQTEQMQTTMQNDTASGLTARKAIGEEQARKAMDTLQKYRQGKSALEARVIASEDWWRMRSWQQLEKELLVFKEESAMGQAMFFSPIKTERIYNLHPPAEKIHGLN